MTRARLDMIPMNKMKLQLLGAVGLLSSSASCTELTQLGVSGELSAVRGEGSMLAAPRYFTTLTAPAGRSAAPNTQIWGDVDGDGLDDLLIGLMPDVLEDLDINSTNMTVYLFYGRAQLPEQISFDDADATFDTGYQEAGLSLGDVNADGRADFMLGDQTGFEIVFGSPQRYSGHHARFSAGLKWIYGGTPRDENGWQLRFFRAWPLGDINGDGANEFVLQATVPDPTHRLGLRVDHYLFEGRTSDWPSGAWDPLWAAARFDGDNPNVMLPYPIASGDIDGDGYSDIITRRDDRFWLYYGGPRGLQGNVTESLSDAELVLNDPWGYVTIIKDIDGDGADELQVGSTRETQIVYGSTTRFSGDVALQADLTFVDKSGAVYVGDYNADGFKDLIITAYIGADPESTDPLPPPVTYELRGTGTRLTGRIELTQAQQYRPVGYAAPDALARGGDPVDIGDFDGDGSTDLLLGDSDGLTLKALYLLPGTGPTPE